MNTQLLIRWVPYVAAFVFITGFARLGVWQLDRAQEKAELFAQYEERQTQTASTLRFARISDLPRYATVELEGAFDERSILLDNQTREGRTGIHVYTPLIESGTGRAVLVNRGWLVLDPARRQLPAFNTPEGGLHLTGLASPPPRVGLKLGDTKLGSQWPQLVTYLDIPELSEALNLDLVSHVVLLSPDALHGFEREWKPKIMGPDKHRGYAFQWFALSLTVFIVTVLLAWRQRS